MKSFLSRMAGFFLALALVLSIGVLVSQATPKDASAAGGKVKPAVVLITVEVNVKDGKISKIEGGREIKASHFPKGTELFLRIKEVIETTEKTDKTKKESKSIREKDTDAPTAGYYEIVFTHKDSAIAKLAVKTDPVVKMMQEEALPPTEYIFTQTLTLGEAGQDYSLKITRYNTLEDGLKEKVDGCVIYEDDFGTYHKYYVGLNAGWLFPIGENSYSYTLFPRDPADATDGSAYTIHQTRHYQTKAILFVSFFPWGVEPEAPQSWRNIHFNLGTEVSSSILKSLHFGLGYDLGVASLNVFFGYSRVDRLAPGYSVGQDIVNQKIDGVPLVGEQNWQVGLCLGLPINLALVFGKILGL
jgi:hypothetical protein